MVPLTDRAVPRTNCSCGADAAVGANVVIVKAFPLLG